MTHSPRQAYDPVAQALHWIIALAILGMFPLAALMHSDIWSPEVRGNLRATHETMGVLILGAGLLRLLWRVIKPQPHLPPPGAMPAWQRLVAQIVHTLLYILAIALPLSGWTLVSTRPHEIVLLDRLTLPKLPIDLLSADVASLRHFFKESHEVMATLLLGLIALHIAAALKHHFTEKDDVLLKMMPAFTWHRLNRLRNL